MKRLLAILLFALSLRGTTTHHVFGKIGGQTLYRGYDLYIEIDAGWLNAASFAVDPATDVVTTDGGRSFTEELQVYFASTGTLPYPLNSHISDLKVSGISGNTFKIKNPWAIGTVYVDFSTTGTGTHSLGTIVSGGESGHLYLKSLSGLPSGVSVTYLDSAGRTLGTGGSGKWPYTYGGYPPCPMLKLSASPTATLGSVTATLTMQWGDPGDEETLSIPITVADVPATAYATPASYPDLPGKTRWENQMVAIATKWCYDPTFVFTFTYEPQMWYYDGSWGLRQVADYTGLTTWDTCAANIERQHRDFLLNNSPRGNTTGGWRAFTDGLLRFGHMTKDVRYLNAIDAVHYTVGGAFPSLIAGSSRDDLIRDTSYRLETGISYEQITGRSAAQMVRTATYLLGIFDNLFGSNGAQMIHESFWDGLAMRSLIKYWYHSRDPRVPPAIKRALDWLWTNAWSLSNKSFIYNPGAYGPTCFVECSPTYYADLNQLIIPAYAWYWSITGDDTYRARYDEAFAVSIGTVTYTVDTATDTVTVPGHGQSNGDRFKIISTCQGLPAGCPQNVPSGLEANGTYYVCSVTENTFTLSSASNCSSTVNITSTGNGFMNGRLGQLYGGAVETADSGKKFGQGYRYSIEGVRWRTGMSIHRP